MGVLDIIIKVLGAVGGGIGTVLGIYNLVQARRKEAREFEEKRVSQQLEVEERELLNSLLKDDSSKVGYQPEIGSKEHEIVERMIEKGKLERIGDSYHIVGRNRWK